MNNFERVRDLVNQYVFENGNETEMSREKFLQWVHETYDNISAAKNNLYPTDLSYNLYNAGLKDFPGPNLCLIYVEDRNTFRLVGNNYKHTGPVYQYKGKHNEKMVGYWNNGMYHTKKSEEKVEDFVSMESVSEDIKARREDLADGIKRALKLSSFDVKDEDREVIIEFLELFTIGVYVEDEGYKIFDVSKEWTEKTNYHCEKLSDNTGFYYLETIDECIGEIQRLVKFEIQRMEDQSLNNSQDSKEFSRILDKEAFKKAYTAFMNQADSNMISKKSEGSTALPGFSKNPICYGVPFSIRYGGGAASASPYMNWWRVSIYYIPKNGKIMVGIEEDKYSHLDQMRTKPLSYEKIGNKKINTAIFYSTTKSNVNYDELYENFIHVCEEVIRLGLE